MRATLLYKKNEYSLSTDKDGQCEITIFALFADKVAIRGEFHSGHSRTGAKADSFQINLREADARVMAEAILRCISAEGTDRVSSFKINGDGA
jgi:hypothetical protein